MLDALLDAAVAHVPFDGWSPTTFSAAVADVGIDPVHANTLCPRGSADLAVAYHVRGDAQMMAALTGADLTDMRFRDRVVHAIKLRLADADKEVVRRGSSLFALPHMAPEGAKLIWGTADAIWTALGDTSDDVNWYTKRATLSAVYGSVVLFWLGDDGTGIDDFIDRRIENVMQFEKVKAQINDSAILKPFTGALARLTSMIKAPKSTVNMDLPGVWRDGADQ
ncbi:MAG: ubiquinone biosynthesis protein COQ9 [Yoonia sp.]|jgi:ubiquinone biosynthesis protein COQ9